MATPMLTWRVVEGLSLVDLTAVDVLTTPRLILVWMVRDKLRRLLALFVWTQESSGVSWIESMGIVG